MKKKTDAIKTMVKSPQNYDIPGKNHDLLSDLPDELLINLVSRLPTKDSVQTSILSRRWTNIWKHTHNVAVNCLDHASPECRKLMRELIGSPGRIEIDDTQMELIQNGVLGIVKLLSSFQPSKGCSFHVIKLPLIKSVTKVAMASCVEFARRHHVKDFALECFFLRHVSYYLDDCHLPGELFQISSLVTLKLVMWDIKYLPATVSLPFLRTLVLENIRIGDQTLEDLISSCSSLETLSIKDIPNFFKSIYIKNANLKTLHLDVLYAFRLNTPSLELLQIDYRYRFVTEEDYVLEDVSPSLKCQLVLHEPTIILRGCPYWKVLAALHRVQTIDFKFANGDRSFILPVLPEPRTLVNLECTCMAFEVSLNKYEDLKLVAGLLALASHIKKLVFVLKEYGQDDAFGRGWECFRRIFPPCIELEEVEIHGFIQPTSPNSLVVYKSCKRKIKLLKLLMNKSEVLKKITVHVDEYIKSAPMLQRDEFSKCLRRIQRCSKAPSSPIINLFYS